IHPHSRPRQRGWAQCSPRFALLIESQKHGCLQEAVLCRVGFNATGIELRTEHRVNQMEPDLSDRIRERAYEIWIESGYRDGEAEQHWLTAEQEVLSAQLCTPAPSGPAKRVRGRATSKRSKG